jgi:tetratricopeptide (TPR) repeat protein
MFGGESLRQGAHGEIQVYRRSPWGVNSAWVFVPLLLLSAAAGATGLEERLERSRWLEAELARLAALVEEGRAVEVEAVLDELSEEVGDDPRWQNLWGTVLAARGDHRGAVERYTRAIRLDPSLVEPHLNLAVSLVRLGVTGRALSEFRQAAELDPTRIDAHLGLGRELVRLRRYAAALEPLRTARELAPRDPRVLRVLGEAAAGAGRVDLALEVWREVERLDPDAVSARRVAELLRERDPDAAASSYDDCVDRDPAAVECREAAAALHLQAGRAEAARKRLDSVIDELSPVALQNLYLATLRSEGPGAVAALRDRREPATGAGWGVLALALRDLDRGRQARDAVERGLALDPRDADLHSLHGVLLSEAGDREAARAAWRRALDIRPDHPEARANLDATGGS